MNTRTKVSVTTDKTVKRRVFAANSLDAPENFY